MSDIDFNDFQFAGRSTDYDTLDYYEEVNRGGDRCTVIKGNEAMDRISTFYEDQSHHNYVRACNSITGMYNQWLQIYPDTYISAIRSGGQRRNGEFVNWVQTGADIIRREDLIAFATGSLNLRKENCPDINLAGSIRSELSLSLSTPRSNLFDSTDTSSIDTRISSLPSSSNGTPRDSTEPKRANKRKNDSESMEAADDVSKKQFLDPFNP